MPRLNLERLEEELKEVDKKAASEIRKLVNIYNALGQDSEIEQYDEKIDSILQNLFEVPYVESIVIPKDFLQTEIANLLFSIKFFTFSKEITGEKFYTIAEVRELLGCSKQYIYGLIKDGKVQTERKGATHILSENQVEQLLNKKGKSLYTKEEV